MGFPETSLKIWPKGSHVQAFYAAEWMSSANLPWMRGSPQVKFAQLYLSHPTSDSQAQQSQHVKNPGSLFFSVTARPKPRLCYTERKCCWIIFKIPFYFYNFIAFLMQVKKKKKSMGKSHLVPIRWQPNMESTSSVFKKSAMTGGWAQYKSWIPNVTMASEISISLQHQKRDSLTWGLG